MLCAFYDPKGRNNGEGFYTNTEICKVYGNDLVMLESLVMCTVYTNKFTFCQLNLRLGISKLKLGPVTNG